MHAHPCFLLELVMAEWGGFEPPPPHNGEQISTELQHSSFDSLRIVLIRVCRLTWLGYHSTFSTFFASLTCVHSPVSEPTKRFGKEFHEQPQMSLERQAPVTCLCLGNVGRIELQISCFLLPIEPLSTKQAPSLRIAGKRPVHRSTHPKWWTWQDLNLRTLAISIGLLPSLPAC